MRLDHCYEAWQSTIFWSEAKWMMSTLVRSAQQSYHTQIGYDHTQIGYD